jgi:chromosome segregation ATPase
MTIDSITTSEDFEFETQQFKDKIIAVLLTHQITQLKNKISILEHNNSEISTKDNLDATIASEENELIKQKLNQKEKKITQLETLMTQQKKTYQGKLNAMKKYVNEEKRSIGVKLWKEKEILKENLEAQEISKNAEINELSKEIENLKQEILKSKDFNLQLQNTIHDFHSQENVLKSKIQKLENSLNQAQSEISGFKYQEDILKTDIKNFKNSLDQEKNYKQQIVELTKSNQNLKTLNENLTLKLKNSLSKQVIATNYQNKYAEYDVDKAMSAKMSHESRTKLMIHHFKPKYECGILFIFSQNFILPHSYFGLK